MKTVIFFIWVFSMSTLSFGQYHVGGQVFDERGGPLLGVNIYIKGSYDGSSSDSDGRFDFKTEKEGIQTLVASFIGYKTHENEIDLDQDRVDLNIILKEQINKIDGVTISAGAFEASDKKKSVILRTLDIVTTAGATADITGVMNTLPGTQIVGEEGRLYVRGGAGHEAKTFINGLLVAEPYGLTPQNVPSRFRFSPFLFKGTFFSTGGYSAEYGQALSSILQLNTYDLPARSQTDISIMSVGGDISQTFRKNNTSLYGQLQYTDLSAYYALVPQKDDWDRAPRSINTTLHFKQKTHSGGSIQAYSNFDRSKLIVSQPVPGSIHETGRNDITTQNWYTNVAIKNPLGKTLSYSGGLAYTNNSNLIVTDEFNIESTVNSAHVKLVFDHDLCENILLKYGGELIFDQYDEIIADLEGRQNQQFKLRNHMISPFAEANIYFSNKFMARLGARYELNSVINFSNISPRASLAFKLNDNSQFSMAFGRFSQLPIREYLKWSTNLRTEKASHYILNYQYAKEGRVFRSEVFYKKYDQLVTKEVLSGSEYDFRFDNTGYGEAKGVELFWRDSKTFQNVDYWISYSWLDTKRKYDIFPYTVMPYYASNHNLSIVYKHFVSGLKSQIGWTYSFASGRPFTDPNTEGYNNQMTKSFNDFSLNYSYLPKPNLIIHAAISNVFGFKNIFGYQYNDEPNEHGIYESIAIEPQAKRFLFIGFFITISKNKNANQLNNL